MTANFRNEGENSFMRIVSAENRMVYCLGFEEAAVR